MFNKSMVDGDRWRHRTVIPRFVNTSFEAERLAAILIV